jgi:uncharacterized protein YqhQ
MARRTPPARLAGLSVQDGIILVGRRAWAAAQAMPDGSVRTFSAPLRPPPAIARLPLVRAWTGLVRQASASRDALMAMRGRPVARRWPGVLLALAATAVLSYAGVLFGAMASRWASRNGQPGWTTLLGLAGLFLYMLLTAAIASRHATVRRRHRFHAAEHRVIRALEADDAAMATWRARAPSLPKEHPRCGHVWTFNLVALPYLAAAWLWPIAPGLVGHPLFALGWWLLAVPVLSELSALRPVEAVLAAPGLVLQRFTTLAPTERETKVAEAAATALLEASGAAPAGRPVSKP